jgi:hypothetical protein
MGSGSNFDNLTINANGRVVPSGPLSLASNEEISGLYAWVIQSNADGTGATCIASQEAGGFPSRIRWTTREDTIVQEGRFQPGQALAMAVSVSRAAGAAANAPPIVYWWSETIQLQRGNGNPTRAEPSQSPWIDLLEQALQILRGGGGAPPWRGFS